MANYRKKQKFAGRFTVTQGPGGSGGTTTSHGSSSMKNGRGIRRTTTTKNGKTYTRTTEGSGNGWFRTTQKTHLPKTSKALRHNTNDPFKLTQRDLNKLSAGDAGEGSAGTFIIFGVFLFLIWLGDNVWILTAIKNVFLFIMYTGGLFVLAAVVYGMYNYIKDFFTGTNKNEDTN